MFDDAAHDLDAYKRAAERLCALLPSELSETIAAVAWCSVCPCSLSVIACAHHRSDRAPRKGSVTAYRVQSLRSPLRLSHCVCTACAPGALFVTLHVIASGSVTAWIRAGTRRGTPPTRGGGSTYLQRATSENSRKASGGCAGNSALAHVVNMPTKAQPAGVERAWPALADLLRAASLGNWAGGGERLAGQQGLISTTGLKPSPPRGVGRVTSAEKLERGKDFWASGERRGMEEDLAEAICQLCWASAWPSLLKGASWLCHSSPHRPPRAVGLALASYPG